MPCGRKRQIEYLGHVPGFGSTHTSTQGAYLALFIPREVRWKQNLRGEWGIKVIKSYIFYLGWGGGLYFLMRIYW